MHEGSTNQRPFATLRRFVRARTPAEQCELCSVRLPTEHDHLIEPETRRLLCCCQACGTLFSGTQGTKYRRVPWEIRSLPNFRMTDIQWESLLIPINLAYFFHSTSVGKVVAVYPSPAGATESLLTLETWQELVGDNPVLAQLEPDVEALLVNRLGKAARHYLVPIDQCYKLVGLIRMNWSGLSGGTEVWQEIERFFSELTEKAELYE